jgi:hypothetical protein
MRRIVLLLLPFWLPTLLFGQDLSGKWKGVFAPNQDQDGNVYSYELEIKELPNHTLTVVTYTKFSNNFSAKAIASGMHSENTELVSVIETKFENLKLLGNFQACLMSNYLTYNTIRGRETLEGTYISSNSKMGKDCGSGTVYLEKEVPIVKLIPKKLPAIENKVQVNKQVIAKNKFPITTKNTNPISTSKASAAKPIALAATAAATAASIAPTATTRSISPNNKSEITPTQTFVEIDKDAKSNNTANNISNNLALKEKSNDKQILPFVLIGRENKLVKNITVTSPHISFDMYDNGTIDNDTILVYDNKVLLLNDKGLSYKSVHFELDFSKEVPTHEIIIVAKNLGTVPPNTALMILKEGSNRKEYYIMTNMQTNAMLMINFKAPN